MDSSARFSSTLSKAVTSTRARLRLAVLAGLAACILVVVSWLLFTNREPRFEGKPFSFWLDQIPVTGVTPNGGFSIRLPWVYNTRADAIAGQLNDQEKSDKALKVVDHLGGRCLPMLLRRLQARDSALKTRLVQWLVLNHMLPPSRAPRSAEILRGQALTAILKLDYSAKPIFPELALLAQDPDPQIKTAARFALERLNPAEFSRLERLQSGKK